MAILRAISRFVIGIVFILSGFLKAMDPVGGALKIDEYLKAFHLGVLDFASMPAAILLACTEFLIGVCVLKGIKMKFFSGVALAFTSFFTLLTLYSAIFNPVQDCGCFGEAFHLTNWQTFQKNIILLICAAIIFFQRFKFRPIAASIWKKIYITAYGAFILAISLYALVFLPQIDFGEFKPGTDLISAIAQEPEMEYETTLIYSRDGVEKEFTLENIPDSTWSFVDARTTLVSGSELAGGALNFTLRNSEGTDITEQIINLPNPLFFISIYNPDRLSERSVKEIAQLSLEMNKVAGKLYILNGTSNPLLELESELEKATNNTGNILQTDYKTAIAFNRSNGGATYMNDGIIVKKWSRNAYPLSKVGKILDEDFEILTANVIMKEQIFAEVCIAIILFMILIIRFISKRIYSRSLFLQSRQNESVSGKEVSALEK